MPDDATVLAGAFPPVSREQWRAAVDAVLAKKGGTDLESRFDRLRTVTEDGIILQPLYTRADGPDPDRAGVPGSAPFTRGRTPTGGRVAGWDVRQRIDPSQRRAAVDELERGATSVLVDLRRVETVDADLLRSALDGVMFDVAAVVLDAGPRWAAAADALATLWDEAGIDPSLLTGSLGADPLGELASGGTADIDTELAAAVVAARRAVDRHPGVCTFTIDGTRFHSAGATDAEELGSTIAAAVGTLRALLDADITLGDGCRQIELRVAATVDQFATIAKLRAARRLWARVAEVAGDAEAAGATPLHAVTSMAMMAAADPFVNALRATVACFAASAGGADAITVLAHDTVARPTELGRRLARNTQSILAMESHVAKVVDPAGGSWYVEHFTDQLAEAAWRWFQEIEAAGGFVAAVDAGVITEHLAASRARRDERIATRAQPLVGVSEYPDLGAASLADLSAANEPSPWSHRWSEGFETRRRRAERAVADGNPPAMFLATIGPAATFSPRATWVELLLGAGGIATVAGPVTDDPDAIAEAFSSSGTTVACVASSDNAYAERGAAVVGALRAAGATRIYLAGRETIEGVDRNLSAGSNALIDLDDMLDALAVP